MARSRNFSRHWVDRGVTTVLGFARVARRCPARFRRGVFLRALVWQLARLGIWHRLALPESEGHLAPARRFLKNGWLGRVRHLVACGISVCQAGGGSP